MPSVYIHIPFCARKCPYCDFYSLPPNARVMDEYLDTLISELNRYSDRGLAAETVYFGGGTPNLFGVERLRRAVEAVRKIFSMDENAEITLEVNPGTLCESFLSEARQAGFNRLSMGMQSSDSEELRLLGRLHSSTDVSDAVERARLAGFENLSLDLMLGLPGSDTEKLGRSIEFAASLAPEHISSYILKVEPGTPFYESGMLSSLPCENEIAEQYLFMASELAKHGYMQYEISNFAKPGFESRHNLTYWRDLEYLGFGPSAHSFFEEKRFYYPRSLNDFIHRPMTADDGDGGDIEEFIMLGLRLSEGVSRDSLLSRFPESGERFDRMLENAKKCPPGLVETQDGRISLTTRGFLLSNTLILKLLAL